MVSKSRLCRKHYFHTSCYFDVKWIYQMFWELTANRIITFVHTYLFHSVFVSNYFFFSCLIQISLFSDCLGSKESSFSAWEGLDWGFRWYWINWCESRACRQLRVVFTFLGDRPSLWWPSISHLHIAQVSLNSRWCPKQVAIVFMRDHSRVGTHVQSKVEAEHEFLSFLLCFMMEPS